MALHVNRTENYSTNLANQLWINRKICSDFVIKVNNQAIPCHRLILLANCPVLKSTILSDMKEANSGEVHLDMFSYDVVMCAVKYMYTGTTTFSSDQLLDAVNISHYLEMVELHHLCVDLVPQTLTPDNVVEWLQLATLQNIKSIVKCAWHLIGKSLNEVSVEFKFLCLSLAKVRAAIKAGKEEKANSDDLIRAVFRWISYDKDERITDLEVLLQPINLHDCTAAVLREVQDNYSGIIDSNPAYYKHFYQSVVATKLSAAPCETKHLSVIVLGYGKEVQLLDEKNQLSEISQFPDETYRGIAACATPFGLLVCGGEDDKSYSNRVFLFLPPTQQWNQMQNMKTKKSCHACVFYAGVAFVLGGGSTKFSDEVEKLRLDAESLETEQWQEGNVIPTDPSFPKSSVLCGLLYLMGDDKTDLYILDPKTEVWGTRAKFPISPGRGFSMAAGKEHLYVAGGNQNVCAVYSPIIDAWKVIENKPTKKHDWGAMAMRGNTLVILGGRSADVEQFNTENEVWSTLDGKMVKELTKHQAVVIED